MATESILAHTNNINSNVTLSVFLLLFHGQTTAMISIIFVIEIL